MTAIAGLRQHGAPLSDLLDSMGPRAGSHRTDHSIAPGLGIAIGHHVTRPGMGVVRMGGITLVLDARLETASGERLADPGKTVISLYCAEGVMGFSRLRGEFALALWDGERRQLICARDALGTRPLFYWKEGPAFGFASEERGLAPLYGGEPVADLRVAEFLLGVAPPADCGLRASVSRVMPGTAVLASDTGVETITFDMLSFPRETDDPPSVQAKRFRSLLNDSVRRSISGESVIDCFVSGGLDSSSIAMLAASQWDGRLRTLSLINTERPDLSEQPFIDAVIAGRDFDPVFHNVADYDPFQGAEAAMARHAGPVAAPNLLMMRPLYEAARAGAVLLDGHGGDEVVSKGHGRILDLVRQGSWLRLYLELKGVADLYGDSPWVMLVGLYRKFGPGRYKFQAFERLVSRLLPGRIQAPGDRPLELLAPDFRARSDVDGALAARWRAAPATGREAEFAVLTEPLQSYALEVLDREAQDAGVESRIPFWDRALIDYSMSLPPIAKLRGGWTRHVLRQAMSEDLPEEILWRRDKHDFSQQLREGLRRSPVISCETLERERDRLSPYLDVDRVLALRSVLENADRVVPGQMLQALWRIGLWSIWLKKVDAVDDHPARSLKTEERHVSH